MAAPKKVSDQQRQEIIQLNKEGVSYAVLAYRYGVHWRTISRICNPAEYDRQKKMNIESNKRNAKSVSETRAKNQKYYKLVLTKVLDAEIIAHLDKKDNVNSYLIDLIRKDMCSLK